MQSFFFYGANTSISFWTSYFVMPLAGSDLKLNVLSRAQTKKNRKIVFVYRSKTHKNDVEKKSLKQIRSPSTRVFFRRIRALVFQREHFQPTPLGRFRGGRATQKVAPTKTRARIRISNFSEIPKLLTKARRLYRSNCRTRVFWWYIRDPRPNIILDWSLQRFNQHVCGTYAMGGDISV